MIEMIEGLPAPVVGMRAEGKLSKQDYEDAVIPAVRAMLDGHDRVRLLYVLGDDFDGYSIGAMWEDTKLGVGHLRSFERIACVTDADWVDERGQGLRLDDPGRGARVRRRRGGRGPGVDHGGALTSPAAPAIRDRMRGRRSCSARGRAAVSAGLGRLGGVGDRGA